MNPSAIDARPCTVALHFHGKLGEFYKSWIDNLCLTILTLGIYSA